MSNLGMPDDEDHQQHQLLGDSEASLHQLQVQQPLNAQLQPLDRFSVLSRIPDDVQIWRERVFSLDEPMTLDQLTWEKYWP
jgi:hypothetical protein